MLKVLLVEDSLLLQEMLAGIFSELEGVEFCGSAEGEAEALERMEQSPVDLVIIDIELKQGSGMGVLAALQSEPARYGAPHKAVLTNFAYDSVRQRCERLGMDAFFDKSLHFNQMVDYVREAAEIKNS
jgi:DNA-binding NarL/FixJ family response regulator